MHGDGVFASTIMRPMHFGKDGFNIEIEMVLGWKTCTLLLPLSRESQSAVCSHQKKLKLFIKESD